MKLFDVLLGRTKPAQPDLDALFRLTGASIQLQAAQGLVPSGQAGVCFKTMAGRPFAEMHVQMEQLLGLGDGPGEDVKVHEEDDQYGYHWVVITASDFERLVNLVHLVNSSLKDDGYGPQLLCSVFGFVKSDGKPDYLDDQAASVGVAPNVWQSATPVYIVYLFKQGTFYPFVPLAGEKRDLEGEMVLVQVLQQDLVIEKDLERRFPIWGLPVH